MARRYVDDDRGVTAFRRYRSPLQVLHFARAEQLTLFES